MEIGAFRNFGYVSQVSPPNRIQVYPIAGSASAPGFPSFCASRTSPCPLFLLLSYKAGGPAGRDGHSLLTLRREWEDGPGV